MKIIVLEKKPGPFIIPMKFSGFAKKKSIIDKNPISKILNKIKMLTLDTSSEWIFCGVCVVRV